MTDVSYRSAADEGRTEDDNVLDFPNTVSGRLADLIDAASAPAQSDELAGESEIRHTFRVEARSWSASPRRHGHSRRLRHSAAIAALATVASLIVGSTGLAAATGTPAPAARVVDAVLRHVRINIQPPGTNPRAPANGNNQPVGSGDRGAVGPGASTSGHAPALCDHRHAAGRHDALAKRISASPCSTPPARPARDRSMTSPTTPRSQQKSAGSGRLGRGTGTNTGVATEGGSSPTTTTTVGTQSNRGGNVGTGPSPPCTGPGTTTTTTPTTSTTTTTTTSTTTTTTTSATGSTTTSTTDPNGSESDTGSRSSCGGSRHHDNGGAA